MIKLDDMPSSPKTRYRIYVSRTPDSVEAAVSILPLETRIGSYSQSLLELL